MKISVYQLKKNKIKKIKGTPESGYLYFLQIWQGNIIMIIEECHNQREGLLLSMTLITPLFLLINLQNGQYRYRRRVAPWIVNFFHQSVAVRSIPRNCFVFPAFINFDSRSRMIQQGGLVEPSWVQTPSS